MEKPVTVPEFLSKFHTIFLRHSVNSIFPNFANMPWEWFFLPRSENQRNICKKIFEEEIDYQGLNVIGWREVPVDRSCLGSIAALSEPNVQQIFIGKGDDVSTEEFNAKLFAARKMAEHKIEKSELSEAEYFYLPSLSTDTIIYKGLLMPQDINNYYRDLDDPQVVTKLALVHQRFSTNTFPTWHLAQPFRYMCHNGEINTLRGNLSRMKAREELFESELFGDDLKEIVPITGDGKSDSASMDMVLELLLQTGRSLPEAIMMMVPEAWEKNPSMPDEKKAFYEYNACIMEPWDGPASIPFTDGNYIGALLDRNGLRPSRLKKRVDSGEMAAAFALYPVTMNQLIRIADTGNIMPPKTTWFEPKLRSGLVIHSLD